MAIKRDLYLSLASFTLIAFMALPNIMKLAHAVHGHKNQKCVENIAVHIHEAEFDCEFQKFKLTQQFYPPIVNFEVYSPIGQFSVNSNYYSFLSSFQKLHVSLRGPPNIS